MLIYDQMSKEGIVKTRSKGKPSRSMYIMFIYVTLGLIVILSVVNILFINVSTNIYTTNTDIDFFHSDETESNRYNNHSHVTVKSLQRKHVPLQHVYRTQKTRIWNRDNFKDILKKSQQERILQRVTFPDDDSVIGEVHPNGKLVVNLFNRTDHILWHSFTNEPLCNLLQNMALIDSIPSSTTDHTLLLPHRPLLNLTLDCMGIYNDPTTWGQGNWLTVVYTNRLAAAAARVDFQFNCYEGKKGQMEALLPWVEVYQPAPTNDNPWPYKGELSMYKEACGTYQQLRIDYLVDEITNDMQRLGVSIMGSNINDHRTHPDVPIDRPPLVPNVKADDVIIHFRCGDIFGGRRRQDYGVHKFSIYKKYISKKDTKTLGIVTQPFTTVENRPQDKDTVDYCKRAVFLMVDYLEEFLPEVKIRIHNGPNDSLPLSYARIVMAKQSFTGVSSFGMFPVMGGFGKGYYQRGHRLTNRFNHYLSQYYPNKLYLFRPPFLSAAQIQDLDDIEYVFKWLVTD